MKKMISLFLALVIMGSMAVPAFAAESSEEYYTIPVEYSDNIGHQESLDVMIQNDNVFVDAKMLAERLGYTFGENGEIAMIFNKDMSDNLPFGITQFKYNSTQVSHMLFNKMIDTYEAPFASVKNSEGNWIPFGYSLVLLNSGMMITDDAVLIDIPTKRIIDYFFDVEKSSTKYGFDWADDFGYTETDIKVLGGGSHLINVFNGVLGFDGASWSTLFQHFAGSMDAYDQKYGENLAILLCTESDKELQATIDNVELLNDLLNVDGDLGKLLSFTSDMTDFQVGTLYQQCEAILDGINSGNSFAVDYSRSYQALENALDRQTWFSHTGENILEVQKGVSTATGRAFSFLEVGTKVAEVVGYMQEFQNQDEFSLAALTHYLDTADGGVGLPSGMKKSMLEYSNTLSSSIGEYMTKRFIENVDQWILDAGKDQVPLHKVLGTQAAATLIAWNIASNTIPFIANGLSSADNFELALYSMVFQSDTFFNYLSKRNSVFADTGNITAENMYELSQYCYIYLKSCYVTREAALASLANKSSSTKEKIQPLIDYQNSINAEIAKIMVELKRANKTNEGHVFGFLLMDNEEYLNKYDDSQFIQWIETFNHNVDSKNIFNTINNAETNLQNFTLYEIGSLTNISANRGSDSTTNWEGTYNIAEYKNDNMNVSGEIHVSDMHKYAEDNVSTIDYTTFINYLNGMLSKYFESGISTSEEISPFDLFNFQLPDLEYISDIKQETGDNKTFEITLNTDSITEENANILKHMFDYLSCSIVWIENPPYTADTGFDEAVITLTLDNSNRIQSIVIESVVNLAIQDYFKANCAVEYYFNYEGNNSITNEANSDNKVFDQYSEILKAHSETTSFKYGEEVLLLDTAYLLYDIDKNGVPELIIKEGNHNYYIYSISEDKAVLCGEIYGPYNDCLYEYDGNGIIIHDGWLK